MDRSYYRFNLWLVLALLFLLPAFDSLFSNSLAVAAEYDITNQQVIDVSDHSQQVVDIYDRHDYRINNTESSNVSTASTDQNTIDGANLKAKAIQAASSSEPNLIRSEGISGTFPLEISAGQHYSIINITTSQQTITANAGTASNQLYDYVTYNSDGSVYQYCMSTWGTQRTIPAGGELIVSGIEGCSPVTLNGDINSFTIQTTDQAAFLRQTVLADGNYTYTNLTSQQQTVLTNGSNTNNRFYDYITYYADGSIYQQYMAASGTERYVPAGGKLVISGIDGCSPVEFGGIRKIFSLSTADQPAFTRRTVNAGQTYVYTNLTGSEQRILTDGNNNNNQFYDYATFYANGGLYQFYMYAYGNERYVPAGGKIVVSGLDGCSQVTFAGGSTVFTAESSDQAALTRQVIDAGQSFVWSNGTTSQQTLATNSDASQNRVFDCVVYASDGSLVEQKVGQSSTSLYIPAGGRVVINVLETGNPVITASVAGLLSVEAADKPALFRQSVAPGERYLFTNLSSQSQKIICDGSSGDNRFYEYATYNSDGSPYQFYMKAWGTERYVPAGGKMIAGGIEGCSPVTFAGSIELFTVQTSQPEVLIRQVINSGDNFVWRNLTGIQQTLATDADYSQNRLFDYVFYKSDGNVAEFRERHNATSLLIPAGGRAVMSVTAADNPVTVWGVPQIVSVESYPGPALLRQVVFPGENFKFTNISSAEQKVLCNASQDNNRYYDHASYKADGSVGQYYMSSYGTERIVPVGGQLTVSGIEGCSPVTFAGCPETLTVATSDQAALTRLSITAGQSMAYYNLTNAEQAVLLQGTGILHDFAVYNQDGTSVSSGMNRSDTSISVPAHGQLVISNQSPSVEIKSGVGRQAFEVKPSDNTALLRTVMQSGETYEYANKDTNYHTLFVNASSTKVFDYAIYDAANKMTEQAVDSGKTSFTIYPGCRIVITTNTQGLELGGYSNFFSARKLPTPVLVYPTDLLGASYKQGVAAFDDFYGMMNDGVGSYTLVDPAAVLIGPDTANSFVSLPKDSVIVVGFQKPLCNIPGQADLYIEETGIVNEKAEVYVYTIKDQIHPLGVAVEDRRVIGFDFEDLGINDPVVAVQLVGTDQGGDAPGFDVVQIRGYNDPDVAVDTNALNLVFAKIRSQFKTGSKWYTPERPKRGDEVTFDASQTLIPGEYIASYNWYFGDGTVQTGTTSSTTTHTYNDTGEYTVTLVTKLKDGTEVSHSVTIMIESDFSLSPSSFNLGGNTGTDTMTGPTIKAGGKEFSLFDMPIGLDVSFCDVVKTSYSSEENKYTVLIGDMRDEDTKELQAKVKEIVKKSGFSAETLNDIKKLAKPRKKKMGVDYNAYVCGYMEFSNATGTPQFLEGGIIFVANADASMTYPIPPLPGTYMKFGVEGEVNGKLGLKLIEQGQINQSVDVNGELKLTIAPYLGVGAGLDKIANVEAGVKGELETTLQIPVVSLQDSFKAMFNGYVYFKYQALVFFSGGGSLKFAEFQLYPRPEIQSQSLDEPAIDLNDFKLLPRDYLDRAWVQSVATGENTTTIKANVYPYSSPQILPLGDNKEILLWIDDDSTRSSANRTALMYSVFDGTSWSAAQPVDNDGTADFSPRAVVSGGTVYLVWQNASQVFADTVTIDEMMQAVDLRYARFDGTGFTDVTNLTGGDTVFEKSPVISAAGAQVSVAWIENSLNDIFGLSGTNTVVRRTLADGTWGEARVLDSSLPLVTGIDTGYNNGNSLVAYTVDMDGDVDTGNDSELILINGTTRNQITSDAVDDSNVQFVQKGETADLCWESGEEIKCLEQGSAASIKTIYTGTSTRMMSNPQLMVNQNDEWVLVWEQADGFKSELYGAYYDKASATWGSAIQLTSLNNKIRQSKGYLNNDNSIRMAFDLAQVLELTDSNPEAYGSTDLLMANIPKEGSNLYIVGGISYDSSLVKPGGTLNLSVNVKNNSASAVEQVEATLFDENNAVLVNQTIATTIASGASGEISIPYTLPATILKSTITIQVKPIGFDDIDLSDNSATITLGAADVAIQSVNVLGDNQSKKIQVTVQNTGFDSAQNIKVTISKDNADGEEIENKTIAALAVGESQTLEFNIDSALLVFTSERDRIIFYIAASTDSVEELYGNNSATAEITPGKVTEVVLDQSSIELKIGTSTHLMATVKPDDAVNQQVLWLSDDEATAGVDQNGNVTAQKEGQTKITVVSYDGNKMASCDVKVAANAVLYGDVNQDSRVDGFDALEILLNEAQLFDQMSAEATQTLQNTPETADVNGDNIVNGFDALDILFYEAELYEQMSETAKSRLGTS